MAHIDTKDKAESLNSIIYQLKDRNFDIENCETCIIGGQNGSSKNTIKTIKEIINNNDIKIKEMDVLGNSIRSIQLNLETGEVTDYDETIHSRKDVDLALLRTLTNKKLTEYKIPKDNNKFGL